MDMTEEHTTYSTTCAIDASEAHIAYAGRMMDEQMQFAHREDDVTSHCCGQTLEPVMMPPTPTSEGYITEGEARQQGERWRPELIRITRSYRLVPGAPPPRRQPSPVRRWA